jgi:sigma-B regulation protein RsbU (phosphoserine phosphatase)
VLIPLSEPFRTIFGFHYESSSAVAPADAERNIRVRMSESSTPRAAVPAPESLDSSLLRTLMDTSADRIYFKDLESRIVRNNAAHARSLGAPSPESCAGRTDFDFFSKDHAEQAYADEQRIIRTGEPIIAKVERTTLRDGRRGWASTTKMPWRDAAGRIIGTFGLTRDITEAHEAERRLNDERILLRTILDHLPSRLYVKDVNSRYVLNNRSHLDLLGAPSQESALGRTTTDFFPGPRGEQALADDRRAFGGESLINVEKSDFGPEGDVHWSLVTKVPLHDAHGEIVGLVGISHDITRRKVAEEEARRRGQEMEADLRMARQVQEAFLNRPYPVFPGATAAGRLRFAHRYLPASTLGGDFFDIMRVSDSRCGVLVCDVMGHGVRAGLLTALIRGVAEEVGTRTTDPVAVVAEINRSLMPIVEQTGQPVFATVFFALIDLATGRLDYANAGHPAPLIRHARGEIERLSPADPEPAAGLMADFSYSRLSAEFLPGDLLLAFTDGVFEALGAEGQIFGETRIREVLAATAGRPAEEINQRLIAAVRDFSGRDSFEDDVCVVAIEALR